MKILKLSISGYKNISEIAVDLGNFNALVALNNYGKSNVIEAIAFSNDFIKASNKGKTQMMSLQNRVPINNLIAGKNFEFEIIFETVFEEFVNEVTYAFSFEWIKSENKGKRIINELLKVKKVEKDAKYSTYISRSPEKQSYLNSKTGRCDKPILIEENGLIINKLLNFDDLFYLPLIKEINEFIFSLFSLNNIESNFQTGFILNEKDGEKSEPEEVPSIASFFYKLKNNDKAKYELLVNSIKDLLPDIEYINPIEIDFKKVTGNNRNKLIPFELPEKVYDIRVKISSNNQETSIKNISLGSKRIFYILATTIIADLTGCHLLGYEELENSIHPSLLQKLLIIMAELTESSRILITSHSPHLIKFLDLNDIYIGIPNSNGLATFKKIKKSKQNKLLQYAKDSESNIGDFVFDMLIEGFNDNSFWNDFI